MSQPPHGELTPTSFAMLGLLALRPWTTYELAKQMQRSVRWFWPRAERKLYEEPKRLAALGLATVETMATGRRRSTVYQITTAGRHALRDWLRAGPGAPMQVEMLAAEDDFPERRATNAVALELWVRLHETVRDWSTWAREEVEGWPPEQRGRRQVAAGSPERGTELIGAIVGRIGGGAST